jgi:hypothetical protein
MAARILETKSTAKLKRNSNGTLSFYKNNKHYVHALWVTEIEQPHQVTGSRHQSAHVSHWYPRSYAPGDIQVTIRCRTQTDYQRLANLVRMHQKLLTETPGLRFSGRANSTGLRHLMLLRIPSENIAVHGWIPTFTITKRGVFDPAPQYTFGFFTAIDPYSSNPIISHQIREWWNPKKMKPTPTEVKFEEDPDEGRPTRDIPEIQGGL